ncbi:RNA polymerase sigma factor [Pedobacter agri]|uniref:RNA polymerase sigma factor n=1 Tax=Pedobacter agri TaxID=454586 RepID=UPI00292F04ED|nr:sigma-70 family RNA polymerase sigma factor [Pedobacter agri]
MEHTEFAAAINVHAKQLLTHALNFTRDEDDAKDLLQETLIKGIRFCGKFDSGTNLKGWLFVIMRNTFINDFNRTRKKKDVISVEEELSSAQLVQSSTRNGCEHNFAMEDIASAMNSIRDEYRVPFQLYFEGYKYEEIAQELDIPLGTVKTHIHQARISLKKCLKQYRD